MYFGLAISMLAHGALIAWAILSIHATKSLDAPPPEPIAVALITPSELLRMKQGSETAKELEAKAEDKPSPEVSKLEAEKPKPILAPTPPAETPPEPQKPEPAKAEPEKTEPPKADPIAEKLAELPPEAPGPTPEQLKAEEEKKKAEEEQKKKAEEDRKKEEEKKKKAEEEKKKKLAEEKKKKDEKKKKEAVADRLAALLDKDPTRKGAPNSANEPTKPTDYKGPTAGTQTGNDTVLSVRQQDLLRGMLRQQIARCWRLPGAGGGAETPVVSLRWRMRPDGTVDGEPAIEKPGTGPFGALANEAAVRAVKACQPYDLPQDYYENGWKEVIWEFDPQSLL
ncbi:MAG: protein TolA [Hyphomicrobium sp.]|nr:protein TolA [Hyphomicrobium sp.]